MKKIGTIDIKTIKDAQNGNPHALKSVLRQAEKNIFSYLYYLTSDDFERNDLAQEILLKVVNNLHRLRNPENFKTWLNKIILRQYYDHVRKNKRHAEKINADDINDIEEVRAKADCKTCPSKNCINSEIMEIVQKSVEKLQEPYKMAILMREFQGLSYEEIAKLTKTSTGTVKSRIARARSRLKEALKPYLEE